MLKLRYRKRANIFLFSSFMNAPYFNSSLVLLFWWIFSSGSLYVTYALLQKSSRQKIWDWRLHPFFGMLVFVVCIWLALMRCCFWLLFIIRSLQWASVKICSLNLVNCLNQKTFNGAKFCIRVHFIHLFTKL